MHLSLSAQSAIMTTIYEAVNVRLNAHAEQTFGSLLLEPEQEGFIQEIVKEMGITQSVHIRKMNGYAMRILGRNNVFVYGNYIFVGSNAFTDLPLDQLRFLIGHELGHLKNYHVAQKQLARTGFSLALLISLKLAYESAGKIQLSAVRKWLNNYMQLSESTIYGGCLGLLAITFSAINFRLTTLAFAALSRSCEYEADRESASILQAYQGGIDYMNRWKEYKSILVSLYDYSTLWNRLHSSHPSPDDRIAQLQHLQTISLK